MNIVRVLGIVLGTEVTAEAKQTKIPAFVEFTFWWKRQTVNIISKI